MWNRAEDCDGWGDLILAAISNACLILCVLILLREAWRALQP